MPVLRQLQDELTASTGASALEVAPWSRSRGNVVTLLRGPAEGQAFFAKIFAFDVTGGMSANERYRREKTILDKMGGMGAPELVFAADVERVLVTRAVAGQGIKRLLAQGEAKTAIAAVAQWLGRFHNRFEPHPAQEATLLEHFQLYPEFTSCAGFPTLSPLLSDMPLTELVMSRGDGGLSNFRLAPDRVVGLDFEGAAYRAKEFDMIGMAQGFHALTDESAEDIADWVVAHYALQSPVEDMAKTVTLIARMLPLLSPKVIAA